MKAAALAFLLSIFSLPALAHQAMQGWTYPLECCHSLDCAETSPSSVRETPSGYVVTIQPGSHPMWRADKSAPLVVEFPYRSARPSPDGRWHVCIDHTGKPLCFFAIIGGS